LGKTVAGSAVAVILLATISSCGGGDSTNPDNHTPTALLRISGEGQSGIVGDALPNLLVVQVQDHAGSGVPNVTVHWSVTAGGGSLSAAETTTNQNGQTVVTFTLGPTIGAQSVSASVGSLTPLQFTATAIGHPAKLSYSAQPGTAKAGEILGAGIHIVVQDIQGTTVPSATNSVTIAITSGTGTSGATLSGTVTRTPVGGVIDFSDLRINKVGTDYTLTATSSGLPDAISDAFNIEFGSAVKLGFGVQPSDITAGHVMIPEVTLRVEDSQGNLVPTATNQVTVAVTPGTGGGGSGGGLQAAVNGVATFSISVNKAGSGYTLTATSSALVSAVSTTFSVSPGPPFQLGFVVQPSDATAWAAITPPVQVVVLDAEGNTVTASAIGISVAITSGTGTSGAVLSGTLTRAASSGIASFDDLTIDLTGTDYTLTATASALPSAASNQFAVGAPTIMMQNFRVGQRLVMSVNFFDSGPSLADTLVGPSSQNPNPTAHCVSIPAGRVPSNFFLFSPDDPLYPGGYEMFANNGHWQGGWVVQSIVTPDNHYLYAFPTQTPCKP
jgi:hypothetical protein